jgi:mannosyltransferase
MVLAFGHTLALAVLPSHAVFVALRSGKRALVRWALVAAVAISPALLVALVLTRGTYPTHYEVPDLEALINAPELVLRAAGFGWLLMGLAVTALSRRSASVFLACWLLVPPVVLYVVSHLLTPAFLGRYLLVAAPALMILAARALASSTVTMVVGVILVVALVWSPISSLRSAPSQSQDYRSVAQFISDEQTTGDAILFDHPAHREGIDYYLGSMPGPDDLAFETSAAERGRLYAGEIYPLSDASLDGVERVWVVEQPDQARREEFMEFLGGFDLDQTRNFFALKVSLYTRD